jgi:hypothetical protein
MTTDMSINHGNNNMLNIYSSRSRLMELNSSQIYKSPVKDANNTFKGFSFYSEPIEEAEV